MAVSTLVISVAPGAPEEPSKVVGLQSSALACKVLIEMTEHSCLGVIVAPGALKCTSLPPGVLKDRFVTVVFTSHVQHL